MATLRYGESHDTKKESRRCLLLALVALFIDSATAAEPFWMVRCNDGVFCPGCRKKNVTKYCLYRGHLQWYICKDCQITFDKTGTVLHYRHISVGNWMTALWRLPCGPLNGASMRFIS